MVQKDPRQVCEFECCADYCAGSVSARGACCEEWLTRALFACMCAQAAVWFREASKQGLQVIGAIGI